MRAAGFLFQNASKKYSMDPNNITVFSLLPVFADILIWKNVAGHHGNALTAVWILSNITGEIMLAYNTLNLDSIFTVTKISTNVFQL